MRSETAQHGAKHAPNAAEETTWPIQKNARTSSRLEATVEDEEGGNKEDREAEAEATAEAGATDHQTRIKTEDTTGETAGANKGTAETERSMYRRKKEASGKPPWPT